MGTPAFAASILTDVLEWPEAEVVAVYTQPDRPAGRGRSPRASQVKQLAMARRLPVYQPERLNVEADIAALRDFAPDMIVVAAYGLILPQAVLDIPRLGCLNVHTSLLPKYRGAAPIQRAILAGEHVTGVTIMKMDAGLDTGDILLQRAVGIDIDDTAATLHDELARLGGALLVQAAQRYARGELTSVPQDHNRASYAPKLTKEEGLLDCSQPARTVHNIVRALHPWPGASLLWDGPGNRRIRITLQPGRVGPELTQPTEPGTILGLQDGLLAIACADRSYLVPEVLPEGKRLTGARDFCNGYLCRCDEKT